MFNHVKMKSSFPFPNLICALSHTVSCHSHYRQKTYFSHQASSHLYSCPTVTFASLSPWLHFGTRITSWPLRRKFLLYVCFVPLLTLKLPTNVYIMPLNILPRNILKDFKCLSEFGYVQSSWQGSGIMCFSCIIAPFYLCFGNTQIKYVFNSSIIIAFGQWLMEATWSLAGMVSLLHKNKAVFTLETMSTTCDKYCHCNQRCCLLLVNSVFQRVFPQVFLTHVF